ncbi:MAG: DNA polymerase II, partial [Ignavibacteriaceae bacterium]|nr:DNA polymerase II [Ignavibacteriaceae bacterium]
MLTSKVFILTGEWFDSNGKNIIRLYGITPAHGTVKIIIDNVNPLFFIPRNTVFNLPGISHKRKQLELKSFDEEQLDALYFSTQSDLKRAANIIESSGIKTFEADIDPVKRYLMERFINLSMEVTGKYQREDRLVIFRNPKVSPIDFSPTIKTASIDIETGTKSDSLYSIAVHLTGEEEIKKVFIVGKPETDVPGYITFYKNEKDLLRNFLIWFEEVDPDVIIGWHVIGFDLLFLEKKCLTLTIPFNIGREGSKPAIRKRQNGSYYIFIQGRVVIDGPVALRASFYSFENFKLETVAQSLLGEGKTISSNENKVEEIERMFVDDKIKLAEYNLKDAELVTAIFEKTGLLKMYIKRGEISGLMLDNLGMMTAAFDHFYLPHLHRAGYIASNVKDIKTAGHAAGGYVFEPVPGIYNDVVVLDFKSLYPSIIKTFKIDPLSRMKKEIDPIKTPSGHQFSSKHHFLPGFITHLLDLRSEAKTKNDKYLSQAIKILMNSFYGVMGSYGCRFYHPDLPSAITGTGQFLLIGSRKFLSEQGYQTIYGDTDSLFVKLKDGENINPDLFGGKIAETLNRYWGNRLAEEYKVESSLEIEYEKYYRKFVLTSARSGGETGAKKRYAGLLKVGSKEVLEFVGMEFVRSDWTKLAKEFQEELYSRILKEEEYI